MFNFRIAVPGVLLALLVPLVRVAQERPPLYINEVTA
jgi:hypothetical protein